MILFSILDAIFWGFFASFFGFVTTYLLKCGLSNSTLSTVLAVYMACAFIGAFFWGGQCDKRNSNKKVFIPEFLLTIALAMFIFFMADKNVMISACLYPVIGFLAVPLGSNLDSWMLKSFDQDMSIYGRARGIGSAGYAIGALLVGQLINRFGYMVIPVASLITGGVVFVMVLFTKENHFEKPLTHEIESGNPKELLRIPNYMYMVIILFLSGLAIAPYNNLKIIFLQNVGGDVGVLGIDSFIGVMIQAVFIFAAGSLKRMNRYFRLLVMTSCLCMTLTLAFFAVNPMMIIMGSVCSNISYGVMLPTTREITEGNVPDTLKSTAHALSDAMYGSFSGIIALLYSGTLMDKFGTKAVPLLGIFIMFIPIAMSAIKMVKKAD